MMVACWCSLAGTAACQHCRNNPMATDVWTNKTVIMDHVEAKPFGNGIDVCPVCRKPLTIGKPITNADRIRSMTDEEMAKFFADYVSCHDCPIPYCKVRFTMERLGCQANWLDWLKKEFEDD